MDNAETKFKEEIRSANLEQKVNGTPNECPDQAYKTISDTITNAYDKYFPLIETRFRRDRHDVQPWMNDDLRSKITSKDKIYLKYRKAKEGSTEKAGFKDELNSHNQEISSDIIEAKKTFYSHKIELYKNDMKKTWSTINQIINRRRTKTKYPSFF